VSSGDALALSGAKTVVGLMRVGYQHTDSGNEATGAWTTSWRLAWIVAWDPRSAWIAQPKAGLEDRSRDALVQEVAFVDANTGEVYAHVWL
jgi:hypothetical protein